MLYNPSDSADGRASCFSIPDKALTGQVHQGASGSPKSKAKKSPFGKWFGGSSPISKWRNLADETNPGTIVRFEQGGSVFQLVDINNSHLFSVDLRTISSSVDELVNVQSIRKNEWLLYTTNESVLYSLTKDGEDGFTLKEASVAKASGHAAVDTRSSIYPQQSVNSARGNTVMVHPEAYLQSLEAAQNSSFKVQSAMRDAESTRYGIQGAWAMNSGSFVVNAKSDDDQVDIEVTFPESHSTKTIVLASKSVDENGGGGSKLVDLPRIAGVAESHNGRHLVTLQEEGEIRFWQLDQAVIENEVTLWKQMFGVDDLAQDRNKKKKLLQLKLDGEAIQNESTPKTGLDKPKYGKEDPKNEPHIGGNTWAGGTGGSDTAGLGGRGGPYRLDKGHPVHQVSQAKKDEVSAETRAKARAMAEEALSAKLQEIDMSEREWETYQTYFSRVEHECSQLRSILSNLESVAQERTWLKHQSSGELDDAKLVDGVTGERLVFKKRGVSDSPFHSMHQSKPKRLLFVMDVSGSMYRFNGQDGRLERVLETSLMIMESFAGFESKLDYAIMGHSGDSPDIPFVDFGSPPADRKERLKVNCC